ncbi:MAG: signal recognition particle-docking protein FtsY [Methylophaga sp.]|nr:signal recognition particle-docking protein FtsY [Methylophaga sp.]
MFSFLKKKTADSDTPSTSDPSNVTENQLETIVESSQPAPDPIPEKQSLFGRLKQGLSRSSQRLTDGFADLLLGKKTIDDELLEDLETQLLSADLGIEATQSIINDLTQRVARKQLADPQALFTAMRDDMVDLLKPVQQPLVIKSDDGPFVILMVGINGVGKTTTIGKLAKQFQAQGHSVMLAAGDTFRAAAVEQLQVWGERNAIPVMAQQHGADSASVIFDALQAAKSRHIDILIADTAGRLHTQSNLMEELKKVKRVMTKLDPAAPHEVMLVVDAGTGQNALSQAQQFNAAIGLNGITLTKLDGTAKGGIIFAIAKKTGLPIRYIGVGEKIDDLRSFDAEDFVDALLGREDTE